jgi:hypothetical protein
MTVEPMSRTWPRRVGASALTALIAIGIGGLLSTAGDYLGWRVADPAPSPARMTQILDSTVPGFETRIQSFVDTSTGHRWSQTGLPFAWDRTVGDYMIPHLPTGADTPGRWMWSGTGPKATRETFDATRAHLEREGWKIGPNPYPYVDPDTETFTAVKDGTHLEWNSIPAAPPKRSPACP